MQSVTTDMARRQLSQLLEQVYYTNAQIQIRRNKRPMAWLVSAPFIDQVSQLFDRIDAHSPALAETLAIMFDEELVETIRQGEEEIKAGNTLPIKPMLKGSDGV